MRRTMVGTLGRITRASLLPLAAMVLPAVASAQYGVQRGVQRGVQQNGQRELFEWRGTVDQEIRVQMRGGRTSIMDMGPREQTAYDQARAVSAMPAADGYVSVQVLQGRGRVDVVQQPTAQNGYTTVVRVRDTQGGAAPYAIAAYWQPTGNYGYGNGGAYGSYGRPYPNGGTVQQPVQQPVYGGGKQLPGASSQTTSPVYGRYPYPASQTRVNPNGKVLPGQAQAAQSRGRGHHKHDRDHDDQYDRD